MSVGKNNTKKGKKETVTPSNNAELNALVGIKAKVEYLLVNWFEKKFHEEYGDLIQNNVSKCIGCAIQSVAVYWKNEQAKDLIQAWKVAEAKKINSSNVTTSILDEEPQRNKIVSYTTENSTKSLKELYFELGEAHEEKEKLEAKIELLETELQEKKFAVK